MSNIPRSPLPWTSSKENRLVSNIFSGERPIARLHQITDGSGRKEKYPDGIIIIGAAEVHSNAVFIVRACNNYERLLELSAECLWRRDYPQGGSLYKTYDSLPFHDKRIYRNAVEEGEI